MRDDSFGTPSEAPRKMRFKPKVPPRKVAKPSETTIKAPQAEEDNNEYNEWQKLVKDVSRRRGPKSEKKRQLLMDDHPTLFWTPCAAHCIDLMLHDICKLPIITRTVKRAIALNGYIYNHPYVLNMMRTFTEQKELIRPGVTRFATVFLTLQSIHNQKNKLRRMFASEEWSTSRYHRDTKGKDAYETVMSVGFWNNIVYSLKAIGPLVKVLRLVDSEKKPAMGYIYEAMDRAKEAISKSFNYNEAKYYEIWEIIDKRWNEQLHCPLHAAGYYLNPEYFYSTSRIESNEELNEGFLKTMARLVPDEAIQYRVETELSIYRYARGIMGSPNAIRNRALWSPEAPMQVAFGYGNTSVSARSDVPKHPTAITRANHQVFTDASASSSRRIEGKEYVEPWDYDSYYPVTLPVRRPYSGNPELLDEEDFGEDSINLVHDETHINPAAELEMMEEKEEEQMLFFQLPASLPLVKRSATEKGKEKVDITNSSWEGGISAKGCKVEELPAGFMGKLLVYKSGAVKMKLGDALFDVSPSLNCTFAQEVAAINTKEKHCCILGELNKRVSVIPDMDFLLDNVTNLD